MTDEGDDCAARFYAILFGFLVLVMIAWAGVTFIRKQDASACALSHSGNTLLPQASPR